jgi:OFA family oxalate/formate antiporter-like MFS transporter
MFPESSSRAHYAWVIVAAAFSMMVISGGMISALGVFVKPIAVELGASRGAVSLAYSIHMLSFGAACFLFGIFADRTGIRRLAFFGGTVYGLSLILTARSRHLWHLYLTYGLLASTGSGALWGPFAPLIARWFQSRRGLALGIVYSGVGIGTLLMLPLAAWIIGRSEWRTALLAFGVAALAVNTAASFFLADRPSDRDLTPYGAMTVGDRLAPQDGDGSDRIWTWQAAFGTWQLWALVATFFLCCVSHSILMLHMVPHATDQRIPSGTAATVLGLTGAFTVVGRIGLGGLADTKGGKYVLLIALAAQTAMAPWLLATTETWALVVFAVLFGVGYGGGFPAYPVISRQYFGMTSLGAIFGLQLAGSMAGMALGGYLGGVLHDLTGSYTSAFLVSLAAGLASIVLAACLCQPKRFPGQVGPGSELRGTKMATARATQEQWANPREFA